MSLQNFDLSVVIPVGIGGLTGGLVIAYIMHKLLSKFYAIVFSVIFGIFVAMIPSVLGGIYLTTPNLEMAICIILVIVRNVNNIQFRKTKAEER